MQKALLLGKVVDEALDPVPNATVQVAGQTVKTDESGGFELSIPGELVKEEMTLDIRAEGFDSYSETVVPNSNEIRPILRKRVRR